MLGKVYGTVLFNDRPNPASFPGCWAYPDMSEVGNFCRNGQPCSTDARASEASHWGLWSIVSSPLILVPIYTLLRTAFLTRTHPDPGLSALPLMHVHTLALAPQGFDMNDSATMDRVWPLITNTEALAVNHAWGGELQVQAA